MRTKSSTVFGILTYFYTTFQLVVERTPYFGSLSTNTYETLISNNFRTFGSINSLLVLREVNAFDYPAFKTGCETIYDEKTMAYLNMSIAGLDPNGTFIRIMLFILAFSTNSRFVVFDSSPKMGSESTSIEITNIQNIFLTMFWKYLIYQLKFTEAVRWFSYFVKNIVDMIQISYEQENAQHHEVIEKATRLLTMDD